MKAYQAPSPLRRQKRFTMRFAVVEKAWLNLPIASNENKRPITRRVNSRAIILHAPRLEHRKCQDGSHEDTHR